MTNIYEYPLDGFIRQDIHKIGIPKFIETITGSDANSFGITIFIADKLFLYDCQNMFNCLDETDNDRILYFLEKNHDLYYYMQKDIDISKSFIRDAIDITNGYPCEYGDEDTKSIREYVRFKTNNLVVKLHAFMPDLIHVSADRSSYEEHAEYLTEDCIFLKAVEDLFEQKKQQKYWDDEED